MTSDLEEWEEILIKEWRNQEKFRIEAVVGEEESVTVNDGESFHVYEKQTNKLYDFTDDELLGSQFNPKEQLDILLEAVKDTHDVEKLGNETILGRDTVHIKASPKEKGEIFGEQELWVDTEHWMVLKMMTKSDDFAMEMEYTTIDFTPSFEADQFELDLPEDVEVEVFDVQSLEETIEVQDLSTILEEAALYMPGKDGYTVESAKVFRLDEKSKMIDLSYQKDGVAYATITIVDPVEDNIDEQLDIFGKEAEAMKVRDQDGLYIDAGQLKMLVWNEGAYQYNLTPIDPTVKLEDLQIFAEKMETVK